MLAFWEIVSVMSSVLIAEWLTLFLLRALVIGNPLLALFRSLFAALLDVVSQLLVLLLLLGGGERLVDSAGAAES